MKAVPSARFSWTFTLTDGGPHARTLDTSWWRERSALLWKREAYSSSG